MCSKPAAIRCLGIVHSFFVSSISAHAAPRGLSRSRRSQDQPLEGELVTGVAGEALQWMMKLRTSE